MTTMRLDDWRIAGREVAVVGLAKSGVAAARLLQQRGFAVYASDVGRSDGLAEVAAALAAEGVAVEVGGHDLARVARAALVVVSPGVPPEAPPLAVAREAGVTILAEVALGLLAIPATRYVAVTGTNGKTTTTALVAHLLRSAGLDAEAAGNIGVPVCEVALRARPPAWLALEVSSFQLHDCPAIQPAVGVLTNLAPNHLDRYATLADYYGDKARLFANAQADAVSVYHGDNEAVQAMLAGVPGLHLPFSVHRRAAGWLDRERRCLMLGDQPLLPRDDLKLLGDHNVENALAAALAVAAAAGAPPGAAAPWLLEAMADGLRSFRSIAHRVEPIRTVDGVLWVNDSKSTNISSTEVAIAALDRPFVLLLGGRHKGEPYGRLAAVLGDRCRAVLAFGEAGPLIARDLGGRVPVEEVPPDLALVLARARALAQPGDAVLLSPACSSYDMFRNYEDRGEQFRAAVQAL